MADADVPALNLRILSPSPDLDGGINLTQLPTTTTVADLRRRIQDAVPSRPAPDSMRLIYRGKVVADDASTLADVFGADNIRQSPDQSLHLVLRELPAAAAAASTSASPAPRSATAPNPFRTPDVLPTSPSLSTNPFRALPRPSSQPPQPHHHHHHHHPHHHHHVQQPLNPLAANPIPAANPLLTTPMPPHIQHQLANALAPGPLPNPLVPGTATNQLPNGGAIRQAGIGPNGERWSVTINDFTANVPLRPGQPMMPRPMPFPAAFRMPPRPVASPAPDVSVPVSWLLPRLRDSLREAALEMANVNTLLQTHTSTSETNLPPWRIQRVRGHLRTVIHSMQMAETALSNPILQLNTDVIAMRQSAAQLRRQAEEISASLDRQQVNTPATTQPSVSQTPQTLPSDAPPELFILSSPQGPVGVLFDQRGTYTTAPMAPTAPMHNFADQFTRNRQLIAGLSHQITRSNLANQLGALRPTPTQPGQDTTQNQAQNQDANQIQNHNQNNHNQNQNQNQDQNADGENDRMMNIGGHLWLVFKLACFVYIFAGGGGWYRPIILALMAAGVYLAQLGIFNDQLNVVRRHFEALLPNTDRLVQGHEAAPQQLRPGARNITPEEAARRILQQHQQQRFSWARDTMRTLERSFAIFVASLWPGIGERMVHAQEERVRAERAAEEAQREEEQRRIEAEAQQKEAEESAEKSAEESAEKGADEKSETLIEKSHQVGLENEAVPGTDEEVSAGASVGASAKGKERAETAA
jgi:hypothetical protein